MLIFSRRRVDVTNFSFRKIDENDGEFTIEFNAEEWAAENILKQVQKQIDIFEAKLVSHNKYIIHNSTLIIQN